MFKRMKRSCTRLLCLVMIFAMLPVSALATGMGSFTLPEEMPELPFEDVAPTDWYFRAVQAQYALGLMAGTSKTTFSPSGTVSLWQAIAVSVRVYETYNGIARDEPDDDVVPSEPVDETNDGAEPDEPVDETNNGTEPDEPVDGTPDESTPDEPDDDTKPEDPVDETPWYEYYITQAKVYGLLPDALMETDLSRDATRAEVAELLYRSLPVEELQAINTIDTLPDYVEYAPYWNSVITLFRAGVLSGQDSYGTFCPESAIKRSELASMLTRLVCPEKRVQKTFAPVPTGMQVFSLPSQLPTVTFTDVALDSWYYKAVQTQSALNLMVGTGEGKFSPDGTVPIAQVVAVAVRVYERYHGLPNGSPYYGGKNWYDYPMAQSVKYNLLPSDLLQVNPTRAATREEVAEILRRALPDAELKAINTVNELPDYSSSNRYYNSVITLYRAGVLSGNDKYGTFNPTSAIKRSELASMLTRLVCPGYRYSFTLVGMPYYETIVYGKSGAGRDLTAYRFGNGKNVMVLTFEIHGWEDNFNRDGQLLVDTAEQLMGVLRTNYESLIRPGDWSVYILPKLNPDGLADGWTCNGPGRCTTHYLTTSGGDVAGKGIDLNRSFPYKYQSRTESRNFNGTQPLQAKEAQALAKFTQSVKGSGKNVLIDTHGWYRQTIVSGGQNGTIYKTFHTYFPTNRYTSLINGSGYYSSWAAYVVGYDACLFEFPDVYSTQDFKNKGYGTAFINAISKLLQVY